MHHALTYVYEKYIKDPKTGKKKHKFLAYAVSMGAMMLAAYLIKNGKNVVPLDGTVLYGAGWHAVEDLDYFNSNFFGLYTRGLCFPVRMIYKRTILPQLKDLMDKESFDEMCQELDEARFLNEMDQAVHMRLMGISSQLEYYDVMAIRGRLKHIKVPTLHISADDDQIFEQYNGKMPADEAQALTNSSVMLCKT